MAQSLEALRHSAAHLLAAAVLELYPHAKPTIGPATTTGFYYDFDFGETKLSEEDLPIIAKVMAKIAKDWTSFERHVVDAKTARMEFAENPYKLELIEDIIAANEPITIYQSGNFRDLCRGGHLEEPNKELKHFALLSVAGAYWRGNEKNKMLTRIYGTAFFSKKELDEHLAQLEDAKARDHKKLGKELGLFTFSETIGKGLPLWTWKGATIRRELERYIVDEEIRRGYIHVRTPDIANLDLYKKSGHYPYYKDSMYAPIVIDDEEYMLRPMTCPHHFELYLSEPHSYRELPMRIAELAQLYRYEQSGELMGLQRVRTFCLADAHIICRKEQALVEINSVLDLIDDVTKTFGLTYGKEYSYRLSLGNRENEEKYYPDPEAWDYAEDVLRQALIERKTSYVEAADEAAFYGPKIDIQMRNVNGKEDTAFTVQYDFVMPKRFQLTFTNEKGESEEAIVIHRSSIGAVERIVAFLIEHYAGAFPLWLSPVQVAILPVSEKQGDAAQKLANELKAQGIRVQVWAENETLGNRIRLVAKEKIPYTVVLGDQEVANGTVAVRRRGSKEQSSMETGDFIKQITAEIATKALS